MSKLALVSDSIVLAVIVFGSLLYLLLNLTIIPKPVFFVACVLLLWRYSLQIPMKPWAEVEEQRGRWEDEAEQREEEDRFTKAHV